MKHLAALAACTFLLAGCAGPPAITLEQEGLANASGKDGKVLACPDGRGSVQYDVRGTGGKLKVHVDDAVEKERKPLDKLELAGMQSGRADDLVGEPGQWTLTVDRDGFSGMYRITLTC